MNELIEVMKDPYIALTMIVVFGCAGSLVGMTVMDMIEEIKERRS